MKLPCILIATILPVTSADYLLAQSSAADANAIVSLSTIEAGLSPAQDLRHRLAPQVRDCWPMHLIRNLPTQKQLVLPKTTQMTSLRVIEMMASNSCFSGESSNRI